MDYGKIISSGWQITWNNKYLWILGFLAALGSVGGASSSGRSTTQSAGSELSPEQLLGIGAAIIAVICVAFVIGIIIWLLSLAGGGGLIRAVDNLENGEKTSLKKAFSAGTSKLTQLAGVGVLLWLPFLLLGIVAAVIAFFSAAAAGGAALLSQVEDVAANPEAFLGIFGAFGICFALMACLLAPLGLIVTFVQPFAMRGVMLQDLGVMDAVRHGWQVLKANATDIILLAILFAVINFLYGLVTSIILLPLAFLLVVPMIASGGDFSALNLIVLIVGGVGLAMIGAALSSIFYTWRSASFTLAYNEFMIKKAG